jgi:hypothetical protein
MRIITKALSFCLAAMLLVQCQKEISHTGSPDTATIEPSPVSGPVQGTVIDENGQPAAGVTVKAGNLTATTDTKGYFRINNAALDKNAALVTAEKAGYFKGYRTFQASNLTNQVEIKLIKRNLAGTVPASAGGAATLSNGAKIELPANGVVVASSGAAYTGDVKVYASYIDPTAADIDQVIPGSLMADAKDGKRVTLASYGMMAVELESTAGEKLQVKSGANATLTTPIPSSLQASAPASIALWSVNETTGLWKEEGTATKNGNNYVGTVAHFSFWNCDISIPAVKLTLTIKNSDSIALRHVHVTVTRTANNSTTHGWTDSVGWVSGLVPANESLVLKIMDQCGGVVYSQNIGPFAQATNLGTIYLPASNNQVVTIKGKLLTCAGTPVMNGFALIQVGNIIRYAATNAAGEYAVSFVKCGSGTQTAHVVGMDTQAQQQGTASTVTIVSPVTNVGTTQACGTSSVQYINYTVDGTQFGLSSTNLGDSLMIWTAPLQGTTLFRTRVNGGNYQTSIPKIIGFNFNSSAQAPGTYVIDEIFVNNLPNTRPVQPLNVVMTSFPTVVGQFYEGSFSGSFRDSSSTTGVLTTHTISGNFKLRK